jgi:hypothetical protein
MSYSFCSILITLAVHPIIPILQSKENKVRKANRRDHRRSEDYVRRRVKLNLSKEGRRCEKP